MSNGPIAADQLRLFLERIERLEEEKKGIADDIKDVYGEAKSQGFDTKTMRAIIRLRKLDVNDRREQEALLDTYKAALGMLDGTPLGTWAIQKLTKKPDGEEAPADDEAYQQAKALVIEHKKASTSWLQRQLGVGYNSAAAHMERMEREGIVSAPDKTGKRTVLQADDTEAADAAAEPPVTVDDAKRMGREAAQAGQPVTANPFPARDERRAAWDEAWCSELGSDGMDIPDAWLPEKKTKPEDKGDEKGGKE